VSEKDKARRLTEIIDTFRVGSVNRNKKEEGTVQLVLVEGTSKRSADDLTGRSEGYKRVVFPRKDLDDATGGTRREPQAGDYVSVLIESSTSHTLIGTPIAISDLVHHHLEQNALQQEEPTSDAKLHNCA
jgi:tRNA-2-methylthio-N6-dimethylallyladenosine synthase